MKIRYTKRFGRDLDEIQHQVKVKKQLLSLIEKIKKNEGLTELRDVKRIEGYTDYYRVRLGDYRVGL